MAWIIFHFVLLLVNYSEIILGLGRELSQLWMGCELPKVRVLRVDAMGFVDGGALHFHLH